MFAKSSQIVVGLLCAAAAVNASPYEVEEKRDRERNGVRPWYTANSAHSEQRLELLYFRCRLRSYRGYLSRCFTLFSQHIRSSLRPTLSWLYLHGRYVLGCQCCQ